MKQSLKAAHHIQTPLHRSITLPLTRLFSSPCTLPPYLPLPLQLLCPTNSSTETKHGQLSVNPWSSCPTSRNALGMAAGFWLGRSTDRLPSLKRAGSEPCAEADAAANRSASSEGQCEPSTQTEVGA